MARSINKSIITSTIFGLDANKEFKINEDGMPIANVTIECNGKPSMVKATSLLVKACKHKNVMVLDVQTNEIKKLISAETFYANSEHCEKDAAYGREFVTQEFKITLASGFYIVDGKMQQFENIPYFGTTTDNKLLNYVRDYLETPIATITKKQVGIDRRYMSREKFEELSKEKPNKEENKEA